MSQQEPLGVKMTSTLFLIQGKMFLPGILGQSN